MNADIPRLAAFALLIWSLVVSSVSFEAMRRYAMRMYRARRATPPRLDSIPILLLRPCAGAEPELFKTLRSARSMLGNPERLHCVFGVEDESDPAYPIALLAREQLQEHKLQASVHLTRISAPNRKAAQLERMYAQHAPYEGVIVVADSDVDLAGVDLNAFIAPLFGPNPVQAVWAPPVERAKPQTLGDRASSAILGASLHAFPLLGGLDGDGLVGKLFAIQSHTLEQIGGFGSLTQILGEDMEIARRIKAHGGRIALAPFPARSLAKGRTFSQAAARFGRWLMMVRAQRPLLLISYPALFFAAPLISAASLVALFYAPELALASLAIAITFRLLVALTANQAQGAKLSLYKVLGDIVLADALMIAAFLFALKSRTVVWRNHTLSVGAKGVLSRHAGFNMLTESRLRCPETPCSKIMD